ncbi:hypothetical protein AGOR_G00108990 [Albula goreensis]|uniref:Uncharacterized protein n=1 Tax=Albula goreensis TaxID=1534307 RepID=A0A8T3DN91_9TELE|nr:hypothetical protein AGOR_G00108990 [Albula goreensis]
MNIGSAPEKNSAPAHLLHYPWNTVSPFIGSIFYFVTKKIRIGRKDSLLGLTAAELYKRSLAVTTWVGVWTSVFV